jgi:hypothetical protein
MNRGGCILREKFGYTPVGGMSSWDRAKARPARAGMVVSYDMKCAKKGLIGNAIVTRSKRIANGTTRWRGRTPLAALGFKAALLRGLRKSPLIVTDIIDHLDRYPLVDRVA